MNRLSTDLSVDISVDCPSSTDRASVEYRSSIGRYVADRQSLMTIGRESVDSRQIVGRQSVVTAPTDHRHITAISPTLSRHLGGLIGLDAKCFIASEGSEQRNARKEGEKSLLLCIILPFRSPRVALLTENYGFPQWTKHIEELSKPEKLGPDRWTLAFALPISVKFDLSKRSALFTSSYKFCLSKSQGKGLCMTRVSSDIISNTRVAKEKPKPLGSGGLSSFLFDDHSTWHL